MRAAGYIRVSSVMQADQGHSLDAQRTLITDYVRAKGWTLVTVFSDVGISGTLSNRSGLQALLERAAKVELDIVIVHTLDRFYRHLPRLLLTLEQLRQHHVAFVSVSEHLDFATPWGKLELAVLGSLAEIYVDKLRAETTKGKQARARKGLWNGDIPFGSCNGLCSSYTDVNGPSYCPSIGQANRGDGRTLVLHPLESMGVRLAYQ